MKKILVLLTVFCLALSLAACAGGSGSSSSSEAASASQPAESQPQESSSAAADGEEVAVMSYEEYMAAELDSQVTIEACVQAKQSWWEDKATVYAQDENGAYFLYNMACSEEDYEKLVPGTKIIVTGYKSEWSGEVEIIDATFTVADDGEEFIALPIDVTDMLGTDDLINHQNQLVTFSGLTVEAAGQDEEGNDQTEVVGYRLVSDLNGGKGTGYYPVIAMLNTKYLITDGNQYPLEYDRRLGNAWFVGKSVTAADADGEMALLGKIDPAKEAVIYNPDTEQGTVTEYPGEGEISLTEYSPNRMSYSCSSPSGGLAVFSEIYYPAGWKAFVDGKESKILRADYVLRALEIEEGDHNIEFIYAPESFRTGKAISAASSLAILACLAIYIIFCTVSSGKRRL